MRTGSWAQKMPQLPAYEQRKEQYIKHPQRQDRRSKMSLKRFFGKRRATRSALGGLKTQPFGRLGALVFQLNNSDKLYWASLRAPTRIAGCALSLRLDCHPLGKRCLRKMRSPRSKNPWQNSAVGSMTIFTPSGREFFKACSGSEIKVSGFSFGETFFISSPSIQLSLGGLLSSRARFCLTGRVDFGPGHHGRSNLNLGAFIATRKQ